MKSEVQARGHAFRGFQVALRLIAAFGRFLVNSRKPFMFHPLAAGQRSAPLHREHKSTLQKARKSHLHLSGSSGVVSAGTIVPPASDSALAGDSAAAMAAAVAFAAQGFCICTGGLGEALLAQIRAEAQDIFPSRVQSPTAAAAPRAAEILEGPLETEVGSNAAGATAAVGLWTRLWKMS